MANKSKRTEISIREIETALETLAEQGLIIDTGKRTWSAQSGSYQIVYAPTPLLFAKKY